MEMVIMKKYMKEFVYQVIFESIISEKYSKYSNTVFRLNYLFYPLALNIALNQFKDLDNSIKIRNEKFKYYLSKKINNKNSSIKPSITKNDCSRDDYYDYKQFYYGLEKWDVPAFIYDKALEMEGFDINIPGSKPLDLTIFQRREKDLYSFRGKIK